jgi:serine protease
VTSYLQPGFGARMPVSVVMPRPHRRAAEELPGRRPVVGILDTGCGSHPWLDDVVRTDVTLGGTPIGYTDAETFPDHDGDLKGPLDGVIDELSGHGTFIAGLVHQSCPDADIVAWRVVPSEGPIVETDLLATLIQVAEVARRYRADEDGGHPLDVLNLSMGYYHESPDDAILFDPLMVGVLEDLAENGVVVVASAGNDSTSRPLFPAAFCVATQPKLPVVSVGALNPNGTDALFSNVGSWVTDYRPGAAVVSTMPTTFQGGLEPVARVDPDPSDPTPEITRRREALDPDDFSGGFGVWSGTSFAAPIAAGALAGAMLATMEATGAVDDVATAVAKAWAALDACVGNPAH